VPLPVDVLRVGLDERLFTCSQSVATSSNERSGLTENGVSVAHNAGYAWVARRILGLADARYAL
jgi:hypothetical protein